MGGDNSCMAANKHLDHRAVGGGGLGKGGDIDSAVLAATNFGGSGMVQRLEISFSAENLPNMDTMS